MEYLNLDRDKVEKVAEKLNVLLASYHLHYQKLRNFHWNLKSASFFVLHEKFEELYDDANVKIDDIAERILTLEVQPISQLSEYLKISTIKEVSETLKDTEMVKETLEDLSELIRLEREVIETADEASDEGTIDMIGGFLGEKEKNCWMLASWLKQHDVHAQEVNKLSSK